MEGKTPWRDGIHHQEEHEAHNQHPQQLQVVVSDEAKDGNILRCSLILPHQTIAAQEKEHGHTVMTEEREQVDGQQRIGIGQLLHEPVGVHREILVLVLLYDTADEVAVVVEHDSHDSDASHGRALRPCQKLLIHLSTLNSQFSILNSQLIIVRLSFQDTGPLHVVVRHDDIELRPIEGCGDASEIEQQMGQHVGHQRTVLGILQG